MKPFSPANNANPKPDTTLCGETADCDGIWVQVSRQYDLFQLSSKMIKLGGANMS